MTRDEHKQLMSQLLTTIAPEHQATATQLMTTLTEDYEQTLTDFEKTTNDNKTLTANNEKLREVNADLFLKVGVTKKESHTDTHQETTNEGEKDLPTFDSLFNEKGDLL